MLKPLCTCETSDYAVIVRGSIRGVGIFVHATAPKTAFVSAKPSCHQYSGLYHGAERVEHKADHSAFIQCSGLECVECSVHFPCTAS